MDIIKNKKIKRELEEADSENSDTGEDDSPKYLIKFATQSSAEQPIDELKFKRATGRSTNKKFKLNSNNDNPKKEQRLGKVSKRKLEIDSKEKKKSEVITEDKTFSPQGCNVTKGENSVSENHGVEEDITPSNLEEPSAKK